MYFDKLLDAYNLMKQKKYLIRITAKNVYGPVYCCTGEVIISRLSMLLRKNGFKVLYCDDNAIIIIGRK